jgi:cell division protein FtsB
VRWLLGVLLILVVLLQGKLWFGDGGLLALRRLEGEIEARRQANARLEERNAALAAEVEDLRKAHRRDTPADDPAMDAIEERARQEMGMIREGETFFLVVEPQVASGRGE